MEPNGYQPQQPAPRRRRSAAYAHPPAGGWQTAQAPSSSQIPPQRTQAAWQQEYAQPASNPPRQEYYAPSQSGNPPRQEYYAPSQSGNPPRQEYYAPPQSGNPPRQEYYAPSQSGNPPSQGASQRSARSGHSSYQLAGVTGPYIPPKPAKPARPRKPAGGGSGGKPPRRSILRTVVAACIALVIIAALAAGGTKMMRENETRQYVAPYDSVYCPGVYVDGISLAGMTREQAESAVLAQAQKRSDEWYVRLTYKGQLVTSITADQLGMQVDLNAVLDDAWQQGHTGDPAQRRAAMEALQVTPWQGYTALPSGDTAVVDTILAELQQDVYRAPVDAALLEFNPLLTYPFTFQQEYPGRMLDVEPLKEKIYQMVSTMTSGDVEVEPTIIQPQVTVAQLQQQLTLRGTASTEISTKSTEDRTNNIRRAFQPINGFILKPGEKMSFNGVVGQRTTKNGFYRAIEYAYGEETWGVGGGVCQASTTLYQAAVYAGLEIVHREPHSDAVNYTEYGKDATVYWEGKRKIDLVIRNNTDHPLYFVAAVVSNPRNRSRFVAKVSIYGADMNGVTYDLVTETVEELEPPEEPEYKKDKDATYVTYVDQEHVARKAQKGYVVASFRVKYQDGVEVERIPLYTDTYKAKPQLIYVGVKEREE